MLIPDHETAVDYLNYEAISQTVVDFLKQNRARAMTVGIHGDWGAGKSSVLTMINSSLSKDKDVACLWFNGWAFQGFDDAKTVLIESTISELVRQRSTVGKVKALGARLIKRVDWLKLVKRGGGLAFNAMTGLPSPDQIESVLAGLKALSDQAKSLSADQIKEKLSDTASFLKPEEAQNVPEIIHHFREEFSQLLEEAKIDQLVVLIDDLDRCLPATAIETLEAIRLFLFVPKTAFVIGADETMIEYAVRQHFPDLPHVAGTLPYARNYLEKLIQVPFRIPALGIPETRTYVTLLLVGTIVGEDHAGFRSLLQKARKDLNQPWLGTGVKQTDIEGLDPGHQADLTAAYRLAQQIGPILAEGTKGNPRQIKRFLNALLVRQAIAKARGFESQINPAILAKLMLAERFQPDFYDHIAASAMSKGGGRAPDLARLETKPKAGAAKKDDAQGKVKETAKLVGEESETAKWSERDWVKGWLAIEPVLAEVDLRPYVFVARDKRFPIMAAVANDLDALVERLCSSEMVVRGCEPQVKALSPTDADQVFGTLRERVQRHGNFTLEPPGVLGMGIVAKHHTRFQGELVNLIAGVDPAALGIWVVKGWNEILTDAQAKTQLITLMNQLAGQDKNAVLKRAAAGALSALQKGGG